MKENELQTAIMSSLQDYCAKNGLGYQHMAFYSNQQGDDLNKICADFVFTLSNCHFYMAEVKVCDENGELQSWDQEQFIANCYFEREGYPIQYFYNAGTVSYFSRPQPQNYGELVMDEVKMSRPSLLPSQRPLLETHLSIKNLFDTKGASEGKDIGAMLTALGENYFKTNGMIAIAYGANDQIYADVLNPQMAKDLSETLRKYAKNRTITQKLKTMLGNYFTGESELLQAMSDPKRNFPGNLSAGKKDDGTQHKNNKSRKGPGRSR